MPRSPDPRPASLLKRLPHLQQWAILIAGSVILAALLQLVGLPAALLLGPMIAGILLATNGGVVRSPRLPVVAAQAVVGCLIARAMTSDIVLAFLRDWPLFLGVVVVIIATSGLLGWSIARFKVLPGSTAVGAAGRPLRHRPHRRPAAGPLHRPAHGLTALSSAGIELVWLHRVTARGRVCTRSATCRRYPFTASSSTSKISVACGGMEPAPTWP